MNINQVWQEWNEDCVLGEGSFGKVYRAKRVEYGRVFYSAVKVLSVPKSQQEIKFARNQGMNDKEIYDYFRGLVDNLLNEITLMDSLKGAKNIVGIEDYKIIEHQGDIGWDIFIRMELLTPFDSFISNPAFSQSDVLKLGVDICSALEVCEINHIVHRDIKPDNIFISRFGEYKLGDFGIARKLETTQANLSRKGTLNYMAPEIYKSEEYGPNVDIYSLGLVLYTLLNYNRMPFLPNYPQTISYKDNEEALGRRLSGEQMPYPCNATPSLGAVIAKACAYNPADRYRSATEFKNALLNEWNLLAYSGNNGAINNGSSGLEYDTEQRFHRTTSDMTANGRIVVDGYSQEDTTVLNGYEAKNTANSYPAAGDELNVPQKPGIYSTAKSSKICMILAYPMALVEFILGIVLLASGNADNFSKNAGLAFVMTGAIMMVAPSNKKAVGICTVALSFSYILLGASKVFSGLQEEFPFAEIVVLVSGLLLLFAGIVFLVQKEARFGGSLCIYSIIVEWLFNFNTYQLTGFNNTANMWHIFVSVSALIAFVWSYGYNSNEKPGGIKKIIHMSAYSFAVLMAAYSVFSIYGFVSGLIG